MSEVREAAALITSLRETGQLDKVRMTAQGLEVVIVRKTWNGRERSSRIFPGIEVVTVKGEKFLVGLTR